MRGDAMPGEAEARASGKVLQHACAEGAGAQKTASQDPVLKVRCDASVGTVTLRVDLAIGNGWTVLSGVSGAGKSSLLRLIAGVWEVAGSSVMLHGRDLSRLPARRRRIGFATQTPALFPNLTVFGNVSFGGRGRASGMETERLLEQFGIFGLRDAHPGTLSGGETQRVAIARAVLPCPDLLLLDESFSGLHHDLREELIGTLRSIQRERARDGRPMPILSVTHDISEIFTCADAVIRMEEGRVVAQGDPAEVLAGEREALLRQLGAKSRNPGV